MTLTLHSETPAKKNSRITLPNGRTIPSKQYRQWHGGAMSEIEIQMMCKRGEQLKTPIDYPIGITISFTHGDLRRRDSDNSVSSILDLLQDSGILADDNWQIVREIHVRNRYEKDEAGAVIEIEPLKE